MLRGHPPRSLHCRECAINVRSDKSTTRLTKEARTVAAPRRGWTLTTDSDGLSFGRRVPETLVFSQWEDVLSIVLRALESNEIRVVRIQGNHKITQRLNSFKTDVGVRVLLLPIKSAGGGLNLTEASHVIMVATPPHETIVFGKFDLFFFHQSKIYYKNSGLHATPPLPSAGSDLLPSATYAITTYVGPQIIPYHTV